MTDTNDTHNFIDKLFAGDESGAADALNAMLDPARVAAEVRRKLGTERALDDFRQSHRDIAEDPMLARVADARLAEHLGGRDFNALEPAEAAAALAAAGAHTRRWLKSVAPRDAAQTTLGSRDGSASSVIAAMKRARGQL